MGQTFNLTSSYSRFLWTELSRTKDLECILDDDLNKPLSYRSIRKWARFCGFYRHLGGYTSLMVISSPAPVAQQRHWCSVVPPLIAKTRGSEVPPPQTSVLFEAALMHHNEELLNTRLPFGSVYNDNLTSTDARDSCRDRTL